MSDENKTRDTIDAVTGLVTAIPIYQDALQPAAKELGPELKTVVGAIHVALAPVRLMVWGYEQIEGFVTRRVAEKLRNVAPEKIQQPQPNIVGPALDALRFSGHDSDLRELYASLLATSLDADTCRKAHPAFVDIIKNMSPDEARIMRYFFEHGTQPIIDLKSVEKPAGSYQVRASNFSMIGTNAGCQHPALVPSYLDNLCRLGLLLSPDKGLGAPHIAHVEAYQPLEASREILDAMAQIKAEGSEPQIVRCLIEITAMGTQFCEACIVER